MGNYNKFPKCGISDLLREIHTTPPHLLLRRRRRKLEDRQWNDDYDDQGGGENGYDYNDEGGENNGYYDDEGGENGDQGDDGDNNGDDDMIATAETYSEENMFWTPPASWDVLQWLFFGLLLAVNGLLFFCFCAACFIPRCCHKSALMMYTAML